jgi:hypothetical protein
MRDIILYNAESVLVLQLFFLAYPSLMDTKEMLLDVQVCLSVPREQHMNGQLVYNAEIPSHSLTLNSVKLSSEIIKRNNSKEFSAKLRIK